VEITLDRYYNRFGQEVSFDDYKEILFRAGDSLQSAELNELQSSIKSDFGRLSDKFLANGAIVNGIELNIDRTEVDATTTELSITGTAGVVYANGEYVNIPERNLPTVSIDTSGGVDNSFKVGVLIYEEEITEVEDPTLKDPAVGTKNFDLPGAARYKIYGQLVLDTEVPADDVIYFELFNIKDGEIVIPGIAPDPDLFSYVKDHVYNVVAKYDRESNGNYLLRGHAVTYIGTTSPLDGSTGSNLGPFWFNVSDGSANVNGYNFEVDYSRFIDLPELVDFELKQDEPVQFTVDGWYESRHTPIRRVQRVSGPVQINDKALVHDHAGSNEEIDSAHQPILSIQRVYQGDTTYVQSTDGGTTGDYYLDGDYINWTGNDQQPAAGSTYYIDFQYRHTETYPNYSSDANGANGDISPDMKKFFLTGFVSGSTVDVDYDFILDRLDRIILDSNGNLTYLKGVPAENGPKAPNNDQETTLSIATVLLQGDRDPIVEKSTNRTFKMSDIQLILDSLNDNSYNIGRIALEQDIMKNQPGASFRGQFVDSFNNDQLRDMGLDNDALTTGGYLELNVNWSTDTADSAINFFDPEVGKTMFNLDTTPSLTPFIEQPHYSKSVKINRYLFQLPPEVNISISPKVYRWVDETIYQSWTRTVNLPDRWVWTPWSWWWGWWWWPRRWVMTRNVVRTSSTTTSETQEIDTPRIIPQIPIKIKSNNQAFNANEPITIKLDEVTCTTLVADGNGTLNGTFNIPANTLSGEKVITAKGDDSGAEGKAGFLAQPLRKIVTTVTTRFIQRIYRWRSWWWWWWGWDPIAQTFNVQKETVVDRLEVVFEVASTTDVTCLLVETENGYPNSKKILAESRIAASDLVPAGQRQAFVFEDKKLIKANTDYAFILLNRDAVAEVRVAGLGERSKDAPQKWLTDPAYQAGVMFSSSNNSAWTAHQKDDIQFWMYSCTFGGEKTIEFSGFTANDASDMILMSDGVVHDGCTIEYSVELVDRVPTSAVPNVFKVNPDEQIPLINRYTGDVKVQAKLKTTNENMTPELSTDMSIAFGDLDMASTYTSQGIEVHQSDAKLVAIIDVLKPSGTTVGTKVQIVDPTTQVISWEDMTEVASKEIGEGWQEVEFEFDLQDGGTPAIHVDQDQTRVRINLATTDIMKRPAVSNLRFSVVKI